MSKITIDQTRCKKDGMCTRVCPASIFVQSAKLTIPKLVDEERCIACGQCVAVCPQEAVSHADFPPGSITPIDFEKIPTSEQVTELIRTRRSIRAFRDKPVENELLEKIINAARFAPSGHNSQSTEFLVVQDKNLLSQIPTLTAQYLQKEIGRFSNPIFRELVSLADRDIVESVVPEIPGFKRMVEEVEAGMDSILFNAPALLVFHGKRNVGYAEINANLALQNASLVAYSAGIGSFYTGWVVAACKRDERIPRLLGISPSNKVYAALALGYPIPKFKNWIERTPARVIWS